MPASTSPVPALASADVPRSMTSAVPSGEAMKVTGPLRATTAP